MPKEMDEARKWTDKQLIRMENRIKWVYEHARDELTEKWNKYMERGQERLSALFNSGDMEAYQKALRSYTLTNEHYNEMVAQTTERLAHVNEVAVAYMNDQMPEIYAVNYNEAAKTADKVGIDFTLVNEAVVKRMIQDNKIELPKKKVDIPKDQRWNTRHLNSAVLQGILQGESMDKIAKRIFPIVDSNRNAAIRNARTMVTGAENRGRNDSYKELQNNGLVLKKVWMATPDGRTRDWHLDMDGQEVDVDKMFIDGLGNELEYPGDPGGAPESVYNCRCTMVTDVLGFRKEDGSIECIDFEKDEQSEHYATIEAEREKRAGEAPERQKQSEQQTHVVVNGKDISETWERRSDKFDFEIEDVMNAQGFDGLPRIVSAEEFDKYVQEANGGEGFIAQRTYSAPDQETLDAYRQQLYEGKWYVDCSTGGAQYGQGMYCAADYNGILSDGVKLEVEHYKEIGEGRYAANLSAERYKAIQEAGNNLSEALRISNMSDEEFAREFGFSNKAVSYVETFTLDPSAKIISHDDIVEKQNNEKIMSANEAKEKFLSEEVLGNSSMTDEERAVFFFKLVDLGEPEYEKWDRILDEVQDSFDSYSDYREYRRSVYDKYGFGRNGNGIDMKMQSYVDESKALRRMDIGSYAVVKGYDAINAEGHGESGSYTVILNRTKVIIKGE